MTAEPNETALLGGGCFWCLEAVFESLRGVQRVVSGYAGGAVAEPSYQAVCSGTTGHAEVVQIDFDPAQITFDDLLDVFFATHDPTTINRQGADVGTQYRSVIFPQSPAQETAARAKIAALDAANTFAKAIVTTIEPAATFYPAEAYHQQYFSGHQSQPYCQMVIAPKLKKLREKFAARVVE